MAGANENLLDKGVYLKEYLEKKGEKVTLRERTWLGCTRRNSSQLYFLSLFLSFFFFFFEV